MIKEFQIRTTHCPMSVTKCLKNMALKCLGALLKKLACASLLLDCFSLCRLMNMGQVWAKCSCPSGRAQAGLVKTVTAVCAAHRQMLSFALHFSANMLFSPLLLSVSVARSFCLSFFGLVMSVSWQLHG